MRKGKGEKEKGKRREASLLSIVLRNAFSVPLPFPFTLYLLPFSP